MLNVFWTFFLDLEFGLVLDLELQLEGGLNILIFLIGFQMSKI